MLEKIKKKYRKCMEKKKKQIKEINPKTHPYTVKKDTYAGQRNNTKGILSKEYIEHTKQGQPKVHIGNPYLEILYQQQNTPIINVSTDTNPTIGFKRLHAMNSLDLGEVYEK